MEQFVKGTCEFMCPKSEIDLRTKQNLLHFYELLDPGAKASRKETSLKKAIKCFARSAAGVKAPKPSELRTPESLYITVEYLLSKIILDRRRPQNFVYDFIFDRLRAVRQEMVMQNFECAQVIKLLEPIVMFLSYSRYRLCEFSINEFDPVICHSHLQECLKKLLCCYDVCEKQSNGGDYKGVNRCVVESIYLLLNIGDAESLKRTASLSPGVRENFLVKLSFTISLEVFRCNYFRSLTLMDDLPPILHGIGAIKLNEIRKKLLQTLAFGYHSKQLVVPVEWLRRVLHYDDSKKMIEFVQLHGVQLVNGQKGVLFNKNEFNLNAEVHQQFVAAVETKLQDVSLPDLLLLKVI